MRGDAGPQGKGAPANAEALWPQAVVFDLDGTVADSFAAIHAALAASLAEAGLAQRDLDWVRSHVGRGAEVLVREAVGEAGDDLAVERVYRRYQERYREIYLDATPPLDGAGEVLEFVAGKTAGRLAVVSNKPAALCRPWLRHWGLDGFVAEVSGPDVTGALKPDPAAVNPVLERLGVAAAEALLVGDMEVDALAGEAVGMPVVIVSAAADRCPWRHRPGIAKVLTKLRLLPGWLIKNGRGWG